MATQAAKKAAKEAGNAPPGPIIEAAIYQGMQIPDQQQYNALLQAMGRDVELPVGKIEVRNAPSTTPITIGRIHVENNVSRSLGDGLQLKHSNFHPEDWKEQDNYSTFHHSHQKVTYHHTKIN